MEQLQRRHKKGLQENHRRVEQHTLPHTSDIWREAILAIGLGTRGSCIRQHQKRVEIYRLDSRAKTP
jgi:hypothetical protein